MIRSRNRIRVILQFIRHLINEIEDDLEDSNVDTINDIDSIIYLLIDIRKAIIKRRE